MATPVKPVVAPVVTVPEPTVTKTYTPLSQIPKVEIGKCSGMLENHMQCWRAGDVQVQTTTVTTVDGKEVVDTTTAQFCYAHAHEQQDVDARATTDKTALANAQAAIAADTAKK